MSNPALYLLVDQVVFRFWEVLS